MGDMEEDTAVDIVDMVDMAIIRDLPRLAEDMEVMVVTLEDMEEDTAVVTVEDMVEDLVVTEVDMVVAMVDTMDKTNQLHTPIHQYSPRNIDLYQSETHQPTHC